MPGYIDPNQFNPNFPQNLNGGMLQGATAGAGGSSSGGGPGFAGIGQFTANPYAIDQTPYTNLNQTEQNSQNEFAQQLANNNYAAPTMHGQGGLPPARQVQAAALNQDNTNQDRQMQLGLANQLQQQMNGQGPNLAQQQLQSATDQNLKQSLAMAASSQGQQQGGLALRAAQNQQAAIGQQAAEQAAQLRAQQQVGAQQQYGNIANQLTNADMNQAQSQAQLQQQAGLSNQAAQNQFALQQGQLNYNIGNQNLQSQLQTQAQQDKQNLGLLSGQTQLGENQQQNAIGFQNAQAQQNLGTMGLNEKGFEAANTSRGNLLGSLGSAAPGLGSLISSVFAAHGGQVNQAHVRLSPGEIVIPPNVASQGPNEMDEFVDALRGAKDEDDDEEGYACGGVVTKMDHGGVVPGTAKVEGDSLANDNVQAMLKPGSVVMPRTAVQDPMARQQFYQALMSNQQMPGQDLEQAFKARKRA